MKKGIAVLMTLTVLLSACATKVTSKRDLFNAPEEYTKKECYAYDNTRKNMSRNLGPAVGIGIIGSLLGPLGLPFILAASLTNSTIDYTTLPVKCGLTSDDAAREAWTMAYYEDSVSQWWQKGTDKPISIAANPVIRSFNCLLARLLIINDGHGTDQNKSYENRMEICKNSDGSLFLKKEDISEIDFQALQEQYAAEQDHSKEKSRQTEPQKPAAPKLMQENVWGTAK